MVEPAWLHRSSTAAAEAARSLYVLHVQGVKVADWVTHGLGLPQYAEVFRTNSITVRSCAGKCANQASADPFLLA
jgi:hypothetical protein